MAARSKSLPVVVLCLLTVACTAPAPPSTFDLGTDLAWAQLTVALNQRAIQTFLLVPDRATDIRLVSLAQELTAAHTDENARLDAVLRRIGAPQENPHLSHDMPGMATAAEIASMSAARGEAFDRLFAENLHKHLTQCQDLARSMRRSGRLPDALALAAGIESARQRALDRLGRAHESPPVTLAATGNP